MTPYLILAVGGCTLATDDHRGSRVGDLAVTCTVELVDAYALVVDSEPSIGMYRSTTKYYYLAVYIRRNHWQTMVLSIDTYEYCTRYWYWYKV